MSTTLSIPRTTFRRNQILALAAGLVAAAAVAVTLTVAGGDVARPSSAPAASPRPATAQPNAATLYRNESALPGGPARQAGVTAADRFHPFR